MLSELLKDEVVLVMSLDDLETGVDDDCLDKLPLLGEEHWMTVLDNADGSPPESSGNTLRFFEGWSPTLGAVLVQLPQNSEDF